MAQAYTYGTKYYNSDGTLIVGVLGSDPTGMTEIPFVETIPTTMLDDVGDIMALCPIKVGKRPIWLGFDQVTDMDSGANALDADLVIRTTDKAGVHTDVVLFDSSTVTALYFGAAAHLGQIVFTPSAAVVADDADGYGNLCWKIVAAAATGVASVLRGVICVR